ncbi:MAG: TlpA family protein disulfide reductase [Acidobacteriota bacterium]
MARRRRAKEQKRQEVEKTRAAEDRKKRNDRLLVYGAIAAILVAGAVAIAILPSLPTGGSTAPGNPAADFTLVDSQGRSFSLSDFQGKPVVLFFMTTGSWCLPCEIETRDHLVPLAANFGNRIQIISIEMIPQDYGDADLDAYRTRHGSDWIYARDTAGVSQLYGITTLSTIVIVDSQGNIVLTKPDPPLSEMSAVLNRIGA